MQHSMQARWGQVHVRVRDGGMRLLMGKGVVMLTYLNVRRGKKGSCNVWYAA